jgi:D-alanyl-D-alanine carboxypeptidase/D-alanyl-D-alanine-endopeptidase (penicillin-binding protein 4)
MVNSLLLGVISLFGFLGGHSSEIPSVSLVNWQTAMVFDVPTEPDPTVEAIVERYLTRLAKLGYDPTQQGVWIQSEWAELGENKPIIPRSAASLTKIATSIASLEKWGTEHRFITRFYSTGTLENGIISGDLIVEGGNDPLFVWEEAIAVGNALNQLGIREIQGNLILINNFDMNFQEDPQKSGESLKLALNSALWTPSITKAYQSLPPNTPQPQVLIQGSVQQAFNIPEGSQLQLSHQSLTLAEILKQMNIYSNNVMAEQLAQAVGGANVVARIAAQVANVSPDEISLINGSGLGVENRISPLAATRMLMALEDKLKDNPLSVADLFPVAGRDKKGTMQWRGIPQGIAVKTGTLNQVSALAGVIPTQERGKVWFTLINSGSGIERFRAEQDKFLQELANHWQLTPEVTLNTQTGDVFLGDPQRNGVAVSDVVSP